MSEIDTRVTPSLHPDVVAQIDGYGEDTKDVLAPTMTAFSEAYIGLSQVHTAREKAQTNPTWNVAQQVIHTQEFADKIKAKVARSFDSTMANLKKGITHLEGELSAPITSSATSSVSAEIRAHVRSLPTGERIAFVQKAIEAGDEVSASAVLGAPCYLSGVEPGLAQSYTRLYHEKKSPEVAKRLKVMMGARDLIMQRGALLHSEMEKAVGMAPHRVRALREARNESDRAFVLKDMV